MRNKSKIIIDCSSLIYGAFFSYGVLSYNGKPTSVIYGFLSKLISLLNKFKSNKVYFCFDHHNSKRKQVYLEYKKHREKTLKNFTKSELKKFKSMDEQAKELYLKVLPNIGFKNIFRQSGYEADDLMTVVVQKFKKSQYKYKDTIMITSDSDMYQCLDYCDILNPSTMKMITKKSFMDKYNIYPSQWAIAKSLGGCFGDNVIGIKGVADPKKPTSKALKYIRGEIKNGKIYARIESEEGKKIRERNLPLVLLPYKLEEMYPIIIRRDKVTKKKLINTFDKYGFKSFLEFDKFRKWEDVLLK